MSTTSSDAFSWHDKYRFGRSVEPERMSGTLNRSVAWMSACEKQASQYYLKLCIDAGPGQRSEEDMRQGGPPCRPHSRRAATCPILCLGWTKRCHTCTRGVAVAVTATHGRRCSGDPSPRSLCSCEYDCDRNPLPMSAMQCASSSAIRQNLHALCSSCSCEVDRVVTYSGVTCTNWTLPVNAPCRTTAQTGLAREQKRAEERPCHRCACRHLLCCDSRGLEVMITRALCERA